MDIIESGLIVMSSGFAGSVAGAGITLPTVIGGLAGGVIGSVAATIIASLGLQIAVSCRQRSPVGKLDICIISIAGLCFGLPTGLIAGTILGTTLLGGSAAGAIIGSAIGIGGSLVFVYIKA